MTIEERLRQCGLGTHGDPPSVTLTVGGVSLAVQVAQSNTRVHLRAVGRSPVPRADPELLDGLAMTQPGDARFALDEGTLIGTRTLVEPELATLYDAIYALAKATCSAVRALEPATDLAAEFFTSSRLDVAPTWERTREPPQPGGWHPTHVAPSGGTQAWATPDPDGPVIATLDPGVEVHVLERRGNWAHIICYNDWDAWVNGRTLVEYGR